MGRSQYPSSAVMSPDFRQCATVLDFLVQKYPRIPASIWRDRIVAGNVHWEDKTPVTEDSPFQLNQRVFYYREVPDEPVIPFAEQILFQDEQLLVACKPHFLPVTPGGIYVEQCLLHRLRKKTGIDTLTPIHRIDRETAGLVLFSVNPDNRGLYQRMFAEGTISKTYHGIAALGDGAPDDLRGREWLVENRMVEAEQWFRMTIGEGEVNARSTVRCVDLQAGRALFELSPLTGKTHQLRVHMMSLGFPLENDLFYPELQPRKPDNYDKPLQLLAKTVAFTDPVTGQSRSFTSPRSLQWDHNQGQAAD